MLDIRLPPTPTDEGTRAAAEIKAARPEIGVLLLSQHVETAHTVDLVARGGFGICSKTASSTSPTFWPPSTASPEAAQR